MDNKIRDLLSFDPIYESEKILNKNHWSEFDEKEKRFSLAMAILNNERKNEILKQNKDTRSSMSRKEFIEIITLNGFKLGYEYSFPYEDKNEIASIYYRPDGLVIWFTSFFNGESINGGGDIRRN